MEPEQVPKDTKVINYLRNKYWFIAILIGGLLLFSPLKGSVEDIVETVAWVSNTLFPKNKNEVIKKDAFTKEIERKLNILARGKQQPSLVKELNSYFDTEAKVYEHGNGTSVFNSKIESFTSIQLDYRILEDSIILVNKLERNHKNKILEYTLYGH